MAAYLIADIEVTDPAGYEEYKKLVTDSFASYGGRHIARGGKTEVLEGPWIPSRLVIVEFPSLERLKAWYASSEYAPALALRLRCAKSKLVMIEGL